MLLIKKYSLGFTQKINHEVVIFICIIAFYTALCLPYLVDNHFFAPDADRIALDGAFLKDFIFDLPGSLTQPFQYTVNYYAKYPGLSVGYRPIFFQSIEALFYMAIGTSYVTSKITVLCFLFTGMFFWLKLVKETHDFRYAVFSLLLWITNPMVYCYSQQSMLEIPTLSMIIISTYFVYRYYNDSELSFKNAVIMSICVGLTLWTNQKSAFILLVICGYPIFTGRWNILISKQNIVSYFIISLFIVPLAFMTLWLGEQNLSQSVGLDRGFSLLKEITENLVFLYKNHFSIVVILLIMTGVTGILIKKKKNCLFYFTVILSVYLFFTYIKHDIPRYSMYWIPFFCLVAAEGLFFIIKIPRIPENISKKLIYVIIFGTISYQLSLLPNVFVGTASGYEEAAKFTIKNSESPVIWFDGYANGQFIFFVNIHDKKKEMVVLRGDKLISSSSISYTNKLEIHLHNEDEILKKLSAMGVQFIVVESINVSGLEIYTRFREMLKNESIFKLIKTIDVKSNNKTLENMKLLVYKKLDWAALDPEQELILRLPVVGQTLKLRMSRVLPKK